MDQQWGAKENRQDVIGIFNRGKRLEGTLGKQKI